MRSTARTVTALVPMGLHYARALQQADKATGCITPQ